MVEVEIVWVGDELGVLPENHWHGHEVEMNLPPMGFLNKLFDRFGYHTTEGEKTVSENLLEDIERFWAFPGSIKPFLHCEIQMIIFLQTNNIRIQDNAIGCSKLMCWACNAYVEKANKKRGGESMGVFGDFRKAALCMAYPFWRFG